MNKPESDHSKERFRAAKQLMQHLVADQKALVHTWAGGQANRLKASRKHAAQRVHQLATLMNRMKAGEQHVAQAWIQGNKKKTQHELQHAKEGIQQAQTAAKVKETGTKAMGKSAETGQEEAGGLASQVGGQMSDSFATFGSHVAKGQMSLAQAATFLGKEILKDVLDSVATRLLNKGELGTGPWGGPVGGYSDGRIGSIAPYRRRIDDSRRLGPSDGFGGLLAEGALVVRPTLAVIGEGGQPEAVIPADRFAEFGLTGGLQVGKLQMTFPNMKLLGQANHPDFSAVVSRELQAAYQTANQGKN